MPPTSFWQLSAEIDDYLARHPDDQTQTGLMRLLKQCQAAARELWAEEANATLQGSGYYSVLKEVREILDDIFAQSDEGIAMDIVDCKRRIDDVLSGKG